MGPRAQKPIEASKYVNCLSETSAIDLVLTCSMNYSMPSDLQTCN